MTDDKKYPTTPDKKRSGMSDTSRAAYSSVDPIEPETVTNKDSQNAARDSFDGFVPNIPAVATFTAEEAQARDGNYVLSIGLGGSGKSTFHSFLLRYIEQSRGLDYTMFPPRLRSGEEDPQTRNLINQWRATWNRGEFVPPTATTEAAIREIKYRVTPTSGVKATMEFGLIEVSGELLRQVQGGRTGRQSLPEAVHHLIANPRVNLTVLMMVHPDTPNNDLLLTNFIDYLDQKFPGRRNDLALGVVIANPDRALKRLIDQTGGPAQSGFSHYQRLEDEAVFDYMEAMSPGILSKWETWDENKRMLTPLRLGDIEPVTDGAGNESFRLVRTDFTDINKIFDWLYKEFTGKTRGKTWFQKLYDEFDKEP